MRGHLPKVTCVVVVLLTCFSHGVGQAQRTWQRYRWVEVGGVSPDDNVLLMPLRAFLNGEHVVVFDHGDNRIKTFSLGGKLVWSLGRPGSGPGEFRYLRSMAVGPDGAVYLYDVGNARITVVASNGTLRSTATVSTQLGGSLVPLGGGRIAAQAPYVSPFVVVLDSLLDVTAEAPVPEVLKGKNPIQSQAAMVALPGGRVAWVSKVTDRFFYYSPNDSAPARVFRGVDPSDFRDAIVSTARDGQGRPVQGWRPDPAQKYTAMVVSYDGEQLLVLNGNAAPESRRTVDGYDIVTGKYLGSFLLPERCNDLHVVGRLYVCLQQDPAPGVKVWRREQAE